MDNIVFNVVYRTRSKFPCNAVVSAPNKRVAINLLEKAVLEDDRVREEFRKDQNPTVFEVIPTDYGCNNEGVIYFK